MKKLIAFCFCCFVLGVVFPLAGKAATDQVKFLFGATVAGSALTAAGVTTTNPVCFQSLNRRFVLQLNGDWKVGADSTLDVKVEHGFNDGVWKTLDTFTQITNADASQRIHINNGTTNVMQCIRAVITVGGATPSYLASVAVIYENEK